MKHKLYLLFIFVFLISCQESESDRISHLVKEWEGKEIVFPEECSFSIYGKEACAAPALDAPFKIVYYVDSVGCLSCKLNLRKWKSFMQEVDSLSEDKVSFFFYFHPKKNDQAALNNELKGNNFEIPVCIDKGDLFCRQNQLPETESFHAFLLDEQNKVSVIGNPILNPSVRELYFQVLTGTNAKHKNVEVTQVSLSKERLELGSLKIGQTFSDSITIRNIGNNPLIIRDVITSCDCLTANVSSTNVTFGDSTDLRVEFTPEETGEFFKDVFIYCNIEDSSVHVQLHGYVLK